MREILFRGKRIDNGEWVYGFYLELPMGETVILSNKGYAKIDPETVGQFTGLTDKNGKKIFEGDIVQYQPEYEPASLRSFVVYFADKYNYPAFDLAEHNYEANGLQCAHEEGGCEVIGTIYDNPELLEVEK